MDQEHHKQALSHSVEGTTLKETRVCPTCGIILSLDINICPNDKTVLQDSANLGAVLSQNYELIEQIGSGGMGVIFKARHLALDQLVAIKMLSVNRMDDVGIKRFALEAKAIGLLDHPSIVRIRDYGVTESKQPYMVLEYIDANTLQETITFQGQIPLDDTLDIFLQIADALGHAHAHGILHRDLKPSNIMLVKRSGEEPLVKIVDFGIAKIMDSTSTEKSKLTRTGEVFGSPQYMSPEQVSGTAVDARSDIYSTGCVMFEALTGAPPFTGTSEIEIISSQLNEPAPTLREGSLGKVFPNNVEAIVKKALSKNPNDRFQSMDELKEALLIAKSGSKQSIEQMTPEQTDAATSKKFNTSILSASIVLLLGTLCLLAWLVLHRSHRENEQAPKTKTGLMESAFRTSNSEIRQLIKESLNQTKVDLRTLPITDEDLKEFEHSSTIEYIEFSESHVAGPGLAYLIHLPLTHLVLIDADLTDKGLENIGRMKNLDELDLENTRFSNEGLKNLASLTKLKTLHLDDSHLTLEGLRAIENLALKDLFLNRVVCDWKTILPELSKFKSLERLYLAKTSITNDDLKLLKEIKHLQTLDVGFGNITPEGIAYLKDIPTLQVLSLHGAKHFDRNDLTVFKKLKLTHLELRGNEINEDALANLKGTSIAGLNLSDTQITDHALDVIAANPRLCWIIITGCPNLTPARVAALKKQHPKWLIDWSYAAPFNPKDF